MRTLPLLLLLACKPSAPEDDPTPPDTEEPGRDWSCMLDDVDEPDWADEVGCWDDFAKLGSAPLDASIPGARSAKTIVDRTDGDRLYFINSQKYPIHYDFASAHLSGDGLPFVPDLGQFNAVEYYSPDRRFLLGAVTWYEGPQVWAYEIAPYDTADAEFVTKAFREVAEHGYFGDSLYFHPSSMAIEAMAAELPDDIPQITTSKLYEGIEFQPLNLGKTMGLLSFRTAAEVDGAYTPFREIVVLDAIPNDISIVAGIITGAFQTPLSHINVLSQTRGTPNMALRDAWDDPELRALDGKWVEFTVGAFEWTVREISQDEADAWWEANKPEPLETVEMDLTVTDIRDAAEILDLENLSLAEALDHAIPAFGGKGSHYGGIVRIGPQVPVPKGMVIPVYFYDQFMHANGFWERVEAMLADPTFFAEADVRHAQLEQLRQDILAAPLDPDFEAMVIARLEEDFPGIRMRFRSSTTAEDLGDFTGAGLYESKAGQPGSVDEPVDIAIKTVWASVWRSRAFEEREYYSIDHRKIGMAVLTHRSFPDEDANGVAITGNIFDTSGLEPAFYVNVQTEGFSVVLPEPGVVSDQFLYYFDQPGQPVVYLAHSNLTPVGHTVLTTAQIYDLGVALAAIRDYFAPVYAGGAFYGMDTEFKFDAQLEPDGVSRLYLKQARPYPGWDKSKNR